MTKETRDYIAIWIVGILSAVFIFISTSCTNRPDILTAEQRAALWQVVLDSLKHAPPPSEPGLPPPEPPADPPGDGDGFFITDGGVRIPKGKINATSEKSLWKPVAENGVESVVLLPARYVAAATAVSVSGRRCKNTTRDYDLPNSASWPNGARDHWRTSPPITSGTGMIGVMINGIAHQSNPINFAKKQGFSLTPISIEEPPPSVMGEFLVSGGKLLIPEWATARRVVGYTGGLGGQPMAEYGGGREITPSGPSDTLQLHGVDGRVLVDLKKAGDGFKVKACYSINGTWPYPFEKGTKFGNPSKKDGNTYQKYLQ